MSGCQIHQERVEETIRFHGHSCPGLAIGIRAAEFALKEMDPSEDEEVVAVVETDMCGVDAIQFLMGCTFGKGNLIHLDYGKNAFTFFRRSDGMGFRIVTRPELLSDPGKALKDLREKRAKGLLTTEEEKQFRALMSERIKTIMKADLDALFEIKETSVSIPPKARIMDSVICESCGEATMESRSRRMFGQTLCIPCFESMDEWD